MQQHKDINRYSIVTSFYIELKNSESIDIDIKEKQEHFIKWGKKEELYEILKDGFTDQIWLLKQHFKDIKAYTGKGKIINSEFLNDLEDFNIANEKVKEYFKN